MEKQRLSELPDELVLKILSLLPMFEETFATRLISKRWKGPWKLEPEFMFDGNSFESFMSFLYGSLLSNDAQILERLHIKILPIYKCLASDINFCVRIAVNRSVRELRVDLFGKTLELPCCLSTCRTLKTLILHELSIKVVPPWFRLPSLKTLHLLSVKFSGNESVSSLINICPVLECLVIDKTKDDNVMISNIDLPSLRSLSITCVIELRLFDETLKLQSCVSTCKTLEELILHNLSIKFFPRWFLFPSLKTLQLTSVRFSSERSVSSLLLVCPVLECLVVDKPKDDNVIISNIDVPTLRSLSIRSVRELRLFSKTLELGSCLSTCRTLKELLLNSLSIKFVPPWFRMPSLEKLHLVSVKFSGDETVASFLNVCPVLECLVVDQTKDDDNVLMFNIDVPTLRSLTIDNSKGKCKYVEDKHGFVIKAPSLIDLNFKDTFSNFLEFESMPKVIKADIEVICDQSDNFIGSLTSVQHLSFCSLTSKTPYPKDTSFTSLEHLELCTCSAGWANLLATILSDAPKLGSLELKSKHSSNYNDPMILWKEPKDVPKCLSGHLENLEWRQYEGTEQEMKVAEYILAKATCLKLATFSTTTRHKRDKYLCIRMLTKLKAMDRAPETCQLVFNGVVCL